MSSWMTADLADLIKTIQSGGRPKGGVSETSGEIPSLGGENIRQNGGLNLTSVNRIPQKFFNRLSKGVLQPLDVLINKDGANTGKVGIYEGQYPIAAINEHVFLLRGKAEKLDSRFLYYLLLSEYGQVPIKAKISGSAQPGLKGDFIFDFPVRVPVDIGTQVKISDVLAMVDLTIGQTEALIQKHQHIKRGLMQDLLSRGINEDGSLRRSHFEKPENYAQSEIGWIPKGWSVKKMLHLTTKIVDGVHHTPNYVDSGVPFVTVKNLTCDDGINFKDLNYVTKKDHARFLKRADPKPGDVLVTKDGTLGVARIVPEKSAEFSIFVSVALIRPNLDECLPELIWSFFDGGQFEGQLGHLSAGTGLKHIHLEHFKQFILATPPLPEQARIFRIIGKYQEKVNAEQAWLAKLKNIKTGLMQDLLVGRVSVEPLMGMETTRLT